VAAVIRVLGLDISIGGTGVAVIEAGFLTTIRTTRVKAPSLPAAAPLSERLERQRRILAQVAEFVDGDDFGPLHMVAIESRPYGADGQQGMTDLAGVWWRLAAYYGAQSCPLVEVNPGTLKVYATGNGRASKGDMIAAVPAFVTGRPHDTTHDEADAVHLAAMAARALGYPVDNTRSTKQLDAMKVPCWPTTRGTAP
jgi:Holliday junction resolvasome RuvABC endonuclease subunit